MCEKRLVMPQELFLYLFMLKLKFKGHMQLFIYNA